jgi:PAS domain-containing protein
VSTLIEQYPDLAATIGYNSDIYEFLQNTLTDGLLYWNVATPLESWVNSTFWQTLGYAPDQVPTAPAAWRACIDPADLAAAGQLAEACVQDPSQRFDLVLQCTHREGSPMWLRCRAMLLRNNSGSPSWLVGALVDVTKEKQKEAYAQEVATHYSSILSNQSVYILKTDPQGNYSYVNDFFYERFGGRCSASLRKTGPSAWKW